jgi:hypothetical protein
MAIVWVRQDEIKENIELHGAWEKKTKLPPIIGNHADVYKCESMKYMIWCLTTRTLVMVIVWV